MKSKFDRQFFRHELNKFMDQINYDVNEYGYDVESYETDLKEKINEFIKKYDFDSCITEE